LINPHPIISLKNVDPVTSFDDADMGAASALHWANERNADRATLTTFSLGALDTKSTREWTALFRANVARVVAELLHS